MAGINRYPEIELELQKFYKTTSKSVLMEIVRDYAMQLTEDDTGKAISDIQRRKELIDKINKRA